ncbi:MAG: gamma carbonic anhydrase family protein [Microbacterium sp.]|uniref:gamma carbonic anhydrase family protein n=1 Tax=Microbacterium sp. TaxID=51671 RepID=UPI003A8BA6EB
MTIAEGATVQSVAGKTPQLDETSFIAAGARVLGGVTLGPGASVWYNAVLRADGDTITVGAGSNLQDNVSVHVDVGKPVVIGENVSVGHNAVIHGCTIEDGSLIGMGAVVLNGARIGAGTLVAGGAVVLEGAEIPPGSLVAGVPAKARRELTPEERTGLLQNAEVYRTGHVSEHVAEQVASDVEGMTGIEPA